MMPDHVRPLIGHHAWNVQLGVGSMVTVDFGHPLPPDERGRVYGEWHLWVRQGAWRLETDDHVFTASEDSRVVIAASITAIEGQPLTDVDVDPVSLESTFDFAGLRLRVFPIYSYPATPEAMEHWSLYLPSRRILTAGPGSSWSLT